MNTLHPDAHMRRARRKLRLELARAGHRPASTVAVVAWTMLPGWRHGPAALVVVAEGIAA